MKEVLIVVLVAFVMSVFLIFGAALGISEMQSRAVKNGVAEWVVVDHNGNIEFQWITNNVVEVSLDQ